MRWGEEEGTEVVEEEEEEEKEKDKKEGNVYAASLWNQESKKGSYHKKYLECH